MLITEAVEAVLFRRYSRLEPDGEPEQGELQAEVARAAAAMGGLMIPFTAEAQRTQRSQGPYQQWVQQVDKNSVVNNVMPIH